VQGPIVNGQKKAGATVRCVTKDKGGARGEEEGGRQGEGCRWLNVRNNAFSWACSPQIAKSGRVPALPPLGVPRCRPRCPPGAARVLVPLGKLANPMARKAAPHDSPVKGNRVSDLSGKRNLSPQMHCSRQQKKLRRLAPCSAQEEERRRGGGASRLLKSILS
jgi:hypothetical protein